MSAPLAAQNGKTYMPADGANHEPALETELDLLAEEAAERIDDERESFVPRISLKERLLDIKTLIGFGVSAAIILFFILTVKIDFGTIATNIKQANLWFLLAAFAVYYLTFIIRTVRWRMLLQNADFSREPNVHLPPFSGLLEIITISWFVNCIVPAKLGDAYRGYLLKKSANASFSRTLGTIFGERVADLLVLFGLLSVGGLVAFNNVENKLAGFSVIFLFGLALVCGIIVGLLLMRFANHWLEKIIPRRLHGIYHKFRQGTVSTFHRKTMLQLYFLTGCIWACEGARLYFVMQALGIHLGISVVIFIALTSSLLTTIPFTPAGLGAVEVSVVGVLATFNIDKNLAGSVAILDRVVSYWSVIVVGAIVYIFSKKR